MRQRKEHTFLLVKKSPSVNENSAAGTKSPKRRYIYIYRHLKKESTSVNIKEEQTLVQFTQVWR